METKNPAIFNYSKYFTTIYEGTANNEIIKIAYIIYKLYKFNEIISGTP